MLLYCQVFIRNTEASDAVCVTEYASLLFSSPIAVSVWNKGLVNVCKDVYSVAFNDCCLLGRLKYMQYIWFLTIFVSCHRPLVYLELNLESPNPFYLEEVLQILAQNLCRFNFATLLKYLSYIVSHSRF